MIRLMGLMCIAAASMLVSGCGVTSLAGMAVEAIPKAERVVVRSTDALAVAALGYESAARAVLFGVEQGWIKGELAGRIRVVNQQCLDALDVGQRAQTTAARAVAASKLVGLVAKLDTLTPKKGT